MRISRIEIENFRNFRHLDVALGEHAVFAGENAIGKSNLLAALRLVLDPSLPDTARVLRFEDFWDGLRPLGPEHRIRVSVELADFRDQPAYLAQLGDCLVQPDPMVAALTYEFGPKEDLPGPPAKEADYAFRLYGGCNRDNRIDSQIRRRLPLLVLPALRDVEDSLASWRRSPLRPLLDDAAARLGRDQLVELAGGYEELAGDLAQIPEIAELGQRIGDRLLAMVGEVHAFPVHLGFAPTDPERLIRAVRLLVDEQQRAVGEASLGSANLLFLVLKQLELDLAVREGLHDHTFLAIEEPEAHLHPHVQRLVYRSVLRRRAHLGGGAGADPGGVPGAVGSDAVTLLLTTHSPHVVSVAPVRSLVLLRSTAGGGTEAVSTAGLALSREEEEDLERYLDVTRGEILFSRGIILVEGDAETYLLPAFAASMGYDLDRLGITISSVGGTHFAPYVKLLGRDGLDIPFAVITDADPVPEGRARGHSRVVKLLRLLAATDPARVPEVPEVHDDDLPTAAADAGLFLNEHTLEVDLFRSGHHREMIETLTGLTRNAACRVRAREWGDDPATLNPARFLADIETVGKGRFAQRLAANLNAGLQPPAYIAGAIRFVVERLR
jgi:putative ATP-dependent endonuclease of OLD family